MDIIQGLGAGALKACGLEGITTLAGKSIQGALVFERPAFIFNPRRIKSCRVGAFSYINGHGSSALYRVALGRYCSIGEDVVLGPPEHPVDTLSTHPFAFARPDHLPSFYSTPEFARLAPDGDTPEPPLPPMTVIGHDVWVGVGAFVKRGVTIGHGAVVAAHAVVTKDVPPYAIVTGTPAKVHRLRFSERIVERLLQLEWWNYDLAPFKKVIDFANIDKATDELTRLIAEGQLQKLHPETWRVVREADSFSLQRLDQPLY